MYADPMAGNQQKYLALVPPAAPSRWLDMGTLTSGLNLAPGTGNAGTAFIDLPRIPMPYRQLVFRIRGTVNGGAGGGAARTAHLQYDLINNIEISENGGDKFMSLTGKTLYAINKIQGGYRSGEVMGQDVLATAPGAAPATTAFDLSYVVRFSDPTLHPRLFSALNAYEGHGVTQIQIRLDIGKVTELVTGDATATLTITDVTWAAEVLDYELMQGFGLPWVRETAFARLELRELRGITIANASNQKQVLDRGNYFRGVLITDLNAAGTATNANNVTALTVQRDSNDIFINNMRIPHLQRVISDRYSNIFRAENWIYYLDFANEREVSQLINTIGMSQWELLITSGAAGQVHILEVMYNIPLARIPMKDGGVIMNGRKG